eukprot:m.188358 g.188358  ORF g.188358 m.188358 type:complete len:85 (+) comp13630_c0_seq3:1245-1499(+)
MSAHTHTHTTYSSSSSSSSSSIVSKEFLTFMMACCGVLAEKNMLSLRVRLVRTIDTDAGRDGIESLGAAWSGMATDVALMFRML